MQSPAAEQLQVEQVVGAEASSASCSSSSSSSSSGGEAADTCGIDVACSTAIPDAVDVVQLLPGLPPAALAGVSARRVDSRRVTLGARLGSGAYASVFAAQQEGSSSRLVVKRLHRAVADAGRQVAMLLRAGRHPNLVAWHGWCVDASGRLCLLLQRCEGGSLDALLKAHSGGAEQGLFSEGMVMAWFVQLLLGLHHLHRRAILHRDLKPANVLLSANKRVARLADFGTSKALAGHGALAATCAGTPQYAAPEVLACRPYSYAADVWSLGVLLYEMAARRPAHDARGLPQLVVKVLRGAHTPMQWLYASTCSSRSDSCQSWQLETARSVAGR